MDNGHSHTHEAHELCEAGALLYTEALRQGRIAREDVAPAPCLIDMALLHSDPHDPSVLSPAPPSGALARLLRPVARDLHDLARTAAELTSALEPLISVSNEDPGLALTVLDGDRKIGTAIADAVGAADDEILTVEPCVTLPGKWPSSFLDHAEPIRQGTACRLIRQLAPDGTPNIERSLHQLPDGRMRIRTVDRTVEALLIVDRTVVFVPVPPQRDRALEIRHPALIQYFTQFYEVLWALATPCTESVPTTPSDAPVTDVQQRIGQLLAAGHSDEIVARRIGVSVRTCRSHISRLMQALGASSRTHLGALLAQSGIVDVGDRAVPPAQGT